MSKIALLTLSMACIALGAIAQAPSPAQAAWETQVGESKLKNPAYAFVEDDPALPRVLIIGDSISIGYTPDVRELLKGKANVHRIPTNGGPTKLGLEKIEAWLGDGKWDVIHFNWGLHDVKRMKDGALDASMEMANTPEGYEKNLRTLTERLKKTGAKLIWATTTPVPEGANGRIPGDEVAFNTIAAGIMTELDVPTDDLHAWVKPHLAEYQKPADVHYLPAGYAFLAKQVAETIGAALDVRN